jgi:hypothetical protein
VEELLLPQPSARNKANQSRISPSSTPYGLGRSLVATRL